jgi:hypothetical protein
MFDGSGNPAADLMSSDKQMNYCAYLEGIQMFFANNFNKNYSIFNANIQNAESKQP